jgi:hypothetical protein
MARGIWVYAVAATIRREWFGHADSFSGRPPLGIIYPDEAAVTQQDAPPYAAPAGRVPVSQDGQVGCA